MMFSYLMLPNRNTTLLFDERFINYGCNKVQLADHLRFQGYQFFIPSAAFATDVVHHKYPCFVLFTVVLCLEKCLTVHATKIKSQIWQLCVMTTWLLSRPTTITHRFFLPVGIDLSPSIPFLDKCNLNLFVKKGVVFLFMAVIGHSLQ